MANFSETDEYPEDAFPTFTAEAPVPDVARDIANAALSRYSSAKGDGNGAPRGLLTNILPILGTIIGGLITGCSAAHITAACDHVQAHPQGLRARRFHKRIAAQLPDSLGEDRDAVAQSVIDAGMETYNDPDRRAAALAYAKP